MFTTSVSVQRTVLLSVQFTRSVTSFTRANQVALDSADALFRHTVLYLQSLNFVVC